MQRCTSISSRARGAAHVVCFEDCARDLKGRALDAQAAPLPEAACETQLGTHVVLAVEKYRHIAEIVMRRRRGTVTGTAWSRDMYRSIQKAVERLETQVRRRRAKVRTKKRRTPAPAADVRPAATPEAEEAGTARGEVGDVED